MSGPRLANMGAQMNGNRRTNITRMPSNERPMPTAMPMPLSQHDDLIRFIYESWSKVEMDRVMYYQEHENNNLKDFRPFDLEAYWGRRLNQNHQSIRH